MSLDLSQYEQRDYIAASEGSACSAMSWEVTEELVMQYDMSECDPGGASGSVLGAIMLNVDSLNVDSPMSFTLCLPPGALTSSPLDRVPSPRRTPVPRCHG